MNKEYTLEEEAVVLNSYARECFRDTADTDYISARALYQINCLEQFFWYSQQCVEKYLKAIMLYNKVKNPRGGHDIEKLFGKVCQVTIVDQKLEFPEWMSETILHFKRNGDTAARYRQTPINCGHYDTEMHVLDATVFYLRRYAQTVNMAYSFGSDIDAKKYTEAKLRSLRLANVDKKWRSALIVGGRLENIFKGKGVGIDPKRKALIWKNLLFGNGKTRHRKATLRRYTLSTVPPVFRHPEDLELLQKYINIPKKLLRELLDIRNNG